VLEVVRGSVGDKQLIRGLVPSRVGNEEGALPVIFLGIVTMGIMHFGALFILFLKNSIAHIFLPHHLLLVLNDVTFWYQLARVVLEKRPLNVYMSVYITFMEGSNIRNEIQVTLYNTAFNELPVVDLNIRTTVLLHTVC